MDFSDTVNNTGIVQQVRNMIGLDSSQWPTARIANSCNNYADFVTGYAIGHDKRFQWDNTNHTKLPEGTSPLTINVTDYAFTTDEQGNQIITLIGVSRLDSATGRYIPLELIDRESPDYDPATFGAISGTPTRYDKIADNIIRLDYKPTATVAAGLKFYFQRAAPRFTAASTSTTTGFSRLLDRGYIMAASLDAAIAKGLQNLNAISVEAAKENLKLEQYFADRNQDEDMFLTAYQDTSWQL